MRIGWFGGCLSVVILSVVLPAMWVPAASAADGAAVPQAGGAAVDKAQQTPPKADGVPAGKDDLALKSKGTTVKVDSEQEPGCAEKLIDGIIATDKDFSNRWAASLEQGHAHWIEVYLPKVETVGQVKIHFADPAIHPIWFEGFVRPEGSDKWEEVFGIVNYKDTKSFEGVIQPQPVTGFRLLIYESSSDTQPNATQVSEIELFPPKK